MWLTSATMHEASSACFGAECKIASIDPRVFFSSYFPTRQGQVGPRHSLSTDAASDFTVAKSLQDVRVRIEAACSKAQAKHDVRLVAVSKTKPVDLLMDAYQEGQRYFGENYVQELLQKVDAMPDDICWHFIGPLQSNKASNLVRTCGRRLRCVEAVASQKLADKLNAAALNSNRDDPLNVFVQVDTSGEDTKSGVLPKDAYELAKHIVENCSDLQFKGLMTIGAPGDMSCFDRLVACRDVVSAGLGVQASSLELSMGMSGDFEDAIAKGATNVRVGSTIFGARDYSKK